MDLSRIKKLLRRPPADEAVASFSFCEGVWASSISPWHIRRLTEQGRKLGGGIDTASLCGRVEAGNGWDLEVSITRHHLSHCCKQCKFLYEELN